MPVTAARCVSCRRQGQRRGVVQVPIAEKKTADKSSREDTREEHLGVIQKPVAKPVLDAQCNTRNHAVTV